MDNAKRKKSRSEYLDPELVLAILEKTLIDMKLFFSAPEIVETDDGRLALVLPKEVKQCVTCHHFFRQERMANNDLCLKDAGTVLASIGGAAGASMLANTSAPVAGDNVLANATSAGGTVS